MVMIIQVTIPGRDGLSEAWQVLNCGHPDRPGEFPYESDRRRYEIRTMVDPGEPLTVTHHRRDGRFALIVKVMEEIDRAG